jgi:hypothetical protein
MGFLKHFFLPAMCCMHAMVSFRLLVQRDFVGCVETFDWPAKEGTKDGTITLTTWEMHSLGIMGGAHFMMLALDSWSIFQDHGHVRALMAWGELIWWGLGGFDAWRMGFPCIFAYTISVLAAVGLIIHSFEPGLLTKDKNAKEKAK